LQLVGAALRASPNSIEQGLRHLHGPASLDFMIFSVEQVGNARRPNIRVNHGAIELQ